MVNQVLKERMLAVGRVCFANQRSTFELLQAAIHDPFSTRAGLALYGCSHVLSWQATVIGPLAVAEGSMDEAIQAALSAWAKQIEARPRPSAVAVRMASEPLKLRRGQRVTAPQEHAAAILRALQELDIDPLAVPPFSPGQRVGTLKQQVQRIAGLSDEQMKKAWQRMLNEGAIKYA